MLFSVLSIAFAGVPIVLPMGEDEAVWTAALELADLEWAVSARLSVQVVAGRWVIRASSSDDSVRTLHVDRPDDAASREEFAFLARGMARELAMVRDASEFGPTAPPPVVLVTPVSPHPAALDFASRPLPVLSPRPVNLPLVPQTPPPPPQPQVEPVVSVTPVEREFVVTELSPAEEPTPTPEPPVPPVPIPEPEPLEPAPADPDPTSTEPTPVRDLELGGPPVRPRYWDLRVAYPPLFVFGGARARIDRALGGSFGVGVRGVGSRWFVVDLSATYNTAQQLHLPNGSVLFRSEQGLQCEVRPTILIDPAVGLSAMVGVEHRVYYQAFDVIDAATVPIFGGALQVEALPQQRVSPFIRMAFDIDLSETKFLDEFRRVSTVSPVEGSITFGLRFSTRRDPNTLMETLPQ